MESISLPETLPDPLRVAHIAHFSKLAPSQSSKLIDRIIQASKLPSLPSETVSQDEVQAADDERSRLNYAFIDPTKICSKQHILTAVLQAAIVCARSWDVEQHRFREGEGSVGGMKSKTPHSEVIYMLNPGNNIGESLKRFGLSTKSTSLLLVKFSDSLADSQEILHGMIDLIQNTAPETSSTSYLTYPQELDETSSLDVDQAIRYDRYAVANEPQLPPLVTDWKELNKIYKLQMPSHVLASNSAPELRGFEEIICTSVAMKMVAG